METIKVVYPVLGFVRGEIIVNSIVVFLVFVIVGLRTISRLRAAGLGWDDGMIIFAAPLGLAMLVCQGLFIYSGNGWKLPQHPELAANVPYILQLTFCMQIIYVILLATVKASTLFFFLRVFITPYMQLASKILIGFVVTWTISYLAACIFICNPVSAQWDGKGTCGQYIPMIQSLIATNALGDIIIAVLPIHSIWNLQMRKAEKLGVTACFALGFACVVCAVFRLIYISTVDLNGDVTGTMSTTILLFVLEPNIAILCVSIPTLRPLYHMYKKKHGSSKLREYSNERSGYANNANGVVSRKKTLEQSAGRNTTEGGMSAWEMKDYYKHGIESDSQSSEKSLNVGSREMISPNDRIEVETKWTVSHS